jgi:acyl-CoA-binding protein
MRMATLKDKFTAASKDALKLAREPNNDDKLLLYSLYKQSTEGDVKGGRPGMLDLVGRAKYDAWARQKGKTTDAAMQAYVDCVARLKKG